MTSFLSPGTLKFVNVIFALVYTKNCCSFNCGRSLVFEFSVLNSTKDKPTQSRLNVFLRTYLLMNVMRYIANSETSWQVVYCSIRNIDHQQKYVLEEFDIFLAETKYVLFKYNHFDNDINP